MKTIDLTSLCATEIQTEELQSIVGGGGQTSLITPIALNVVEWSLDLWNGFAEGYNSTVGLEVF